MAVKKKKRAAKRARTTSARKSGGRRRSDRAAASAGTPQGNGYSLRDDLVDEALVSGEYRDLLEDYFGEELYAELHGLAVQSRRAQVRGGPKVLVLPGIMGSKLGEPGIIFDDTIWVDPIDIIAGDLDKLELKPRGDAIESLGVLLISYLRIKLRLRAAGFDAEFHHFDWRRDIRELGTELAERIREATRLEDKSSGGRRVSPLYLVAHSMGGLVSRAALQVLAASGDEDCVSRLVMLGTPNFGSFSPVQALSGYHSMIRKVAALDLEHDEAELVNGIFSTFVGLYQMLPAPHRFSDLDLYTLDNWPDTGIAPREALLKAAPSIHDHLAPGDDRFVLIAGINEPTVVGVQLTDGGFVFTQSPAGDGTVPLAFAQLDDVETYFVEAGHGSLPNNIDVIRATIDLLQTGETDRLPTTWTPKRGDVARSLSADQLAPVPYGTRTGADVTRDELRHLLEEFAAPPARLRDENVTKPAIEVSVLSSEPIVVGRQLQGRIDLRLALGNITQVDTRAVVLGLFKGVKPAGAAVAIDEQLDGAISDFTDRRMLSANAGEIFIMPANRYRTGADMVVFAGLGSYDDFSDEVLRLVGENVARALVRTKVDEFATVMLGSTASLSLNDVLKNLMQGFIRGVTDTSGRDGNHARNRLRTVIFCELDKQRFAQMHYEVLRLSGSPLFDDIEVTVDAYDLPPAPPVAGPARALAPSTTPVYLIVREILERVERPTDPSLSASFAMRASLLTAGSKATVVTDSIDIPGVRLNKHLEKIETQGFRFDGLLEFGTGLAEIVLPRLVRHALSELRDYHLVVINDARTSRIPWETICIDGWFPAADAGMSRKYEAEDMTVAKWLEERRLERELNVLLIVNPTLDLRGAEREGDAIQTILADQSGVNVDELRGAAASFSAVQAAFRSGKYDVVHYAGHAFFDRFDRARSGIVCHGHRVLSGADLANVERLPALMFFNACESGRVRGAPARVWSRQKRNGGEATAERLETNHGLAEALLRAGVGNYVGTYWPVQDSSAMEFGTTFYHLIAEGKSIGAAIGAGRARVRKQASVDWADYIHYGNPDFVVKRRQ